ncbi:NUDIX hydrolase [Haematomicrobium sanguinis]|uniref:NUDIX hydrolase n=1 Tax=Haematomicrobium sanguinis TaxID=479106 RepID=UPI000A074F5B|nr:NUDIX hydrolase [Haematomicrobium sanguinis]
MKTHDTAPFLGTNLVDSPATGATPAVPDELPAKAGPSIAVWAAGAVCWKSDKSSLKVLLIHRPRYNDWSFPKGKLDVGETLPECAVREVREEAGIKVRLGVPLPSVTYKVSAGKKHVSYWAAEVTGGQQPHADLRETDQVRWCSPEQARELLTKRADREPLEALIKLYEQRRLGTWPLLILRHAKAKPRSSWTREEGARPLAATGKRQAVVDSKLLQAWMPEKLYSSPWRRCVDTLRPYAKLSDTKIRTIDAITESAAERKPKKARAAFEAMLDKRKPTVICTHRPVLPLALDVLSRRRSKFTSGELPSKDPYLRPGAVIVVHVSKHSPGQIIALETFEPYDD